jgi:hypothetical protein
MTDPVIISCGAVALSAVSIWLVTRWYRQICARFKVLEDAISGRVDWPSDSSEGVQ